MMEGSEELYAELIGRLQVRLPAIADQVTQEVARGRVVAGEALSREDLFDRDARLSFGRFGRVGKSDVAVVPYSGDEKLSLLISAISCAADSAGKCDIALRDFAVNVAHGAEVHFSSPDEARAEASVFADGFSREDASSLLQMAERFRPTLEELRGDE